jgi:hypothetical protein
MTKMKWVLNEQGTKFYLTEDNQPERLNPEVQDFNNGWHRQDTKEHICIWSDEWKKNHDKNLKCDSLTSENK